MNGGREARLTPAQMARVIETGGSVELDDPAVSGRPFVVDVTTARRDSRPVLHVALLSDGRDLRAQTGYRVRVARG